MLLTLVYGILPVNFRMMRLLWYVKMHFDCAGSHKLYICVLASSAFLLNPLPQYQHLPPQHQHHHSPLPWHQLHETTPQYTADVPARNVWLVIKISNLACYDGVLELICARVSVYLCIDLSFFLFLPLSLSLSISIYLYLSLSISIHPSIYLSVCLSVRLSTYLSICLSVCQQVAATWCHSSMSSLPFVIDLSVCLTLLLVAWPCGCLVVCMQLCSAVLWCLDIILISTCGVSALSAVDGMSLSLPCCLRVA